MESISVIIPAFNEEAVLAKVITQLREVLRHQQVDHEGYSRFIKYKAPEDYQKLF